MRKIWYTVSIKTSKNTVINSYHDYDKDWLTSRLAYWLPKLGNHRIEVFNDTFNKPVKRWRRTFFPKRG